MERKEDRWTGFFYLVFPLSILEDMVVETKAPAKGAQPPRKGAGKKKDNTPKWSMKKKEPPTLHTFTGESGPKHHLKASSHSVLDFFYLVFPLSILENMVVETNRYAHQSGKPEWNTSLNEMRA